MILASMVLTTWTTIGSVMLLQMSSQDLNHVGASGASYGFIDKCSNDIISGIWSDLPKCQPRQEVVKLPLPDDPDVVEVIPSHVVVPRCSGVCHQGNLYHQCVPHDKERGTKTFKVMFRRLNSIVECSSVTLETHNSCKCGCDLESANCSEKQDYDHHFCKCRCRNHAERSLCLEDKKRKFWDDRTCQCMCRVEEYKECSTGFIYDAIDTCDCHDRQQKVATAGLASFAAVVIMIIILSAMVTWLCRSNRQLKKRLQNLADTVKLGKSCNDSLVSLD